MQHVNQRPYSELITECCLIEIPILIADEKNAPRYAAGYVHAPFKI